MTGRSTLTIRVLTVFAGIAIAFTLPLKADEAPSAAIARGTELIRAGRYDQAEGALRSGLKRLDGTLNNELYTGTANLGASFYYRGRFAEAQNAFRRALQIWSRLPAGSRPDTAPVLNNMTLVYLRTGQLDAAEQAALDVLASRERTDGPNSSSVASAFITLAAIYQEQGRYEKAETAGRNAVRILSEPGNSDRLRLMASLHQLALVRQKQTDFDEAEVLLRAPKRSANRCSIARIRKWQRYMPQLVRFALASTVMTRRSGYWSARSESGAIRTFRNYPSLQRR